MIQERIDARNATPPCIGIVDISPRWIRLVRDLMRGAGYKILTGTDGLRALSMVEKDNPNLLILGGEALPGMDTYGVVARIREFSSLPVMVVGYNNDEDHIAGILQGGADRYLVKGEFGDELLVASARALLRRANLEERPRQPTIITNGELRINLPLHEVRLGGERVHLTRREFQLLACLGVNLDRTVPLEDIMRLVWGHDEKPYRSVYVYVNRLRYKLEENLETPRYIVARQGVGYLMPDLSHPQNDKG